EKEFNRKMKGLIPSPEKQEEAENAFQKWLVWYKRVEKFIVEQIVDFTKDVENFLRDVDAIIQFTKKLAGWFREDTEKLKKEFDELIKKIGEYLESPLKTLQNAIEKFTSWIKRFFGGEEPEVKEDPEVKKLQEEGGKWGTS